MIFEFSLYRGGKLIGHRLAKNQVTKEGLAEGLAKLNLSPAAWEPFRFFGLIQSGVITLSSSMASPGVVEMVDYSAATRPGVSGGVALIIASGRARALVDSGFDYTFTADGIVTGAFFTTDSTKAGTAGVMFGGSVFAEIFNVKTDDVLNVRYFVIEEANDSIGSP